MNRLHKEGTSYRHSLNSQPVFGRACCFRPSQRQVACQVRLLQKFLNVDIILVNQSFRQFLSRGYAVIFLYRDSSFFPYTRLLLSNKETLFDWLNCDSDGHISLNPPSNLKDTVVTSLTKYKEVKCSNLIFFILCNIYMVLFIDYNDTIYRL